MVMVMKWRVYLDCDGSLGNDVMFVSAFSNDVIRNGRGYQVDLAHVRICPMRAIT